MKSKDVQKITGLTRKALAYDEAQGLVEPTRNQNGYRNSRDEDVKRLSRIACSRRLGLTLAEIRTLIFSEDKNDILAHLIREKEIRQEVQAKKIALLTQLAGGGSLEDIEGDLTSLEAQEPIYDRLSTLFPGYLGQMLFGNYAPFLQEAVVTPKQKEALGELIGFLDQMEDLLLTQEEEQILNKISESMTLGMMISMVIGKREPFRDPERWPEDHSDFLNR